MKKLIATTCLALGLGATLSAAPVQAGSEPYVGEISWFAGNFAPRGWAFCDGQLLAVSQNDALFSLFGTIYGGDGRTTFGLPDMRGRVPMHAGNGPGLSDRRLGQKFGNEQTTLTTNNLPTHTHATALHATDSVASTTDPTNAVLAASETYNGLVAPNGSLNAASMAFLPTGQSLPMTNMQPTLAVRCIVALFGVYPSRQ